MSSNLLFQSFAGGEITPELLGRLDMGKYQVGVAQARNFMVLPHGPLQGRMGTALVNEAWNSGGRVRLLPFSFSDTQTVILEFGHAYIRFHTNGGTLLETAKVITGITQATTGVLTYTGTDPSNNDVMYLTGILGMTQLNGRYVKVAGVNTGANTFQLTDLGGAPIDTSGYTAYSSAGTASRVYTLATGYEHDKLFDIHYTQDSDVLTLSHPSYPTMELARVSATSWTLNAVSFVPTVATPAAPTVTLNGPGGGTLVTVAYVITAVGSDRLEESLASPVNAVSADLSVAGNSIAVSPSVALPATVARFNVYKLYQGLYGYVGQSGPTEIFTDNNITPDTTKTAPEPLIGLNAAVGDYPSAVAYHEQRRAFGGTDNKPQSVVMTRTGTESNLTSSIPSQGDDAIQARIKAREQQRIRHLVPLGDLIALTGSGVWRIFSGEAPAITPDTLALKPQGNAGANNVQPAITEGSILYAQAKGSHIRELVYNGDRQGYVSTDMSIMAPHLFDGYTIVDMAYTAAPLQALWVVRSDGVLLGMTYVPEHQVYAWHQHDTDGYYESVAAVTEGNEDALYCVVRRTLNGREARFIERMASRLFETKADAFVVDCGLTYSGAATDTISGLHHLEGETVSILADGAVEAQQVVTAGAITLSTAASLVHIGLPIEADAALLPLAFMQAPALGQGRIKNVSKVHVRTYRTTGLRVGPTTDALTTIPARSDESYGASPELRTEIREVVISPSWNQNGTVVFRQSDPVPTTILSVALEVAAGG
jgi:hypothetical protein